MHVLLIGHIREMPSPTLAPTSTHHVGILNSCVHRPGHRWQCLGPVDAKRPYLAPLPHPVWWTLPPIHQSRPTREPAQTRTYRDTPRSPSSIQWNPPIYPRIPRALNVSYALVMVIRLSLVRAVIRSVMHARTMAILPVYVHWRPNRNRGRVEGNPLHILAGPIWHYRRALKLS